MKAVSDDGTVTGFVGADTISFTANKYGAEFNDTVFKFAFDKAAGKEEVETNTAIEISGTNTVTMVSIQFILQQAKNIRQKI